MAKCDKSQPGNSQPSSQIGTCLTLPNLGFLWVFFKYPKISKNGNLLFFPVLYDHMTSSSVQRETYTKRQPLSPKYSCPELNSLITYHTLPSLNVCVWLVNTWTLTAPIGSPIICTSAPAHICEQWERDLTTRFSRCSWGRNA